MTRKMMSDNPICVCTHPHSDHDGPRNPRCSSVLWPTYQRGTSVCDCHGFEADPRASE